MKKLLFLFFYVSFLFADDYSFDFEELEQIDVKNYEYSAYIKGEYKYQDKNNAYINNYFSETFLNFKYFHNDVIVESESMITYENIDSNEDDGFITNQFFLNYKLDDNNKINFGKKTSKWGKGYFFNPIAFIDIKKDPNNPEQSREGFTQINYKYNKVYRGDLQNLSLDLVYFKTSKDLNNEFYDNNSNTIAMKTYLLYKNIDIDIAYIYNDILANKLGFDFSFNVETNFELHGEYAIADNSTYSNLFGIKYLTSNELTITSEYFYQNEQLSSNQSFWDNEYLLTKFSQKEPFDIVYFSSYYKNIYNLSDNSQQNSIGFIYTKIKNLSIDLSFGVNSGNKKSEFGTKPVDKYSWLQLKYSF